jgi:Fe-S cluster assembly iron-binding protein IscA
MMINITERAKREFKRLLSQNVDWSQARLRIIDRGQGIIGLGIDIEAPGDQVVEYEGTKVLVIEPKLANNLQGVTIDVDETPEGPELVVLG